MNPKEISAVIDGYLESAWRVPRQTGGETVTIDLGSPQRVAAVEMWLGGHPGEHPRTLAVEISSDGAGWTAVYTGDSALETYDAALRAPLEVPVTFMIQRDSVRLVRLRQTATDARPWSIVELRVLR